MNKLKLEAYLQEFPFLQDILEGREPTEITVKRADENLLARTPEKFFWDGSLGESFTREMVHLVLSDGVKKDAVAQKGLVGSNYAHTTRKEWEGESILEALSRVENPDDVEYIIWESRRFSDWEGSEKEDEYQVIIYKPPKMGYSKLIRRARWRALVEVRAD